MLYPTAGSRLFIADTPAAPGSVAAGAWVEIGEAEALGTVGGSWQLVENAPVGAEVDAFLKDTFTPGVTQLVLGNDPADPGQALLWAALRSCDDYAFRILFRGGVLSRQWRALVVGMGDAFDTANGVIRLRADLQLTTRTWRSEGA